MASEITSLTMVYLTVYSGADQRKHQSSTSLVFVRGIHRWLVNSPHKGPVTSKMFPFDDVIFWVWRVSNVQSPLIVFVWTLHDQAKVFTKTEGIYKQGLEKFQGCHRWSMVYLHWGSTWKCWKLICEWRYVNDIKGGEILYEKAQYFPFYI